MKIQVGAQVLEEALVSIANMTKNAEHATIEAYKDEVWAKGTGNDTTIRIRIEGGKVLKSGSVTVNAPVLHGIVKKRGELVLASKGTTLNFQATKGKYTGYCVCPPLEEIEISERKGKGVKLNKGVQVILEDALNSVGISNIYSGDQMFVHLVSKGKEGTIVLCCDPYHVAQYTHPEVDLDLNLSIPASTLRTISGLSRGQAYSLTLGDSFIHARSKRMEVVLPLVQYDNKELAATLEYMKTFKSPKGKMRVDAEELRLAIANLSGVHEQGSPLEIKCKHEGKVHLSLSSSYGHVEDTLKGKTEWKKGLEVKCDPNLLIDTISTIKDKSLRINVLGDKKGLYIETSKPPVKMIYACCVL